LSVRFDAIGLIVEDMAAALAFYRLLGLDIPVAADGETAAKLVAAGYRSHLAPFDAFWGQRYATVFDPDGNPVDLFAPLT
jgi:uncharacterized glyoxalase superfamily protein PhnB